MKGSIRMGLGFMIVFGAVGGMDNQPGYFLEQTLWAILGLSLMFWGVKALDKHQ